MLKGLEFKSLKMLDLSFCENVTDAGLIHVKELKCLQSLNLGSSAVTDAGLIHLKELKSLQTLNLMGTKVTDAGLAHLKEAKSLEMLNLGVTKVRRTDLPGQLHDLDSEGCEDAAWCHCPSTRLRRGFVQVGSDRRV